MNAKPIRLVPNSDEGAEKKARRNALIRKFIAEIRAKRRGPDVPQGEGEIDNCPTGNYLDIEEVLQRSYRKADNEF